MNMSRPPFTLTPAYGRDYKSSDEVLTDWNADKAFSVNSFEASGSYTNRADCNERGYTEVTVRFAKIRRIVVLTRGPNGWSIQGNANRKRK